MKTSNRMKLQFDSRSANESFARMAVSAFIAPLDPTVDELSDIKTAVSEAVTNCIVHGYRDEINTVTITADIYRTTGWSTGPGPRAAASPTSRRPMEPLFTTCTTGERAGLGFAVMQSLMDKVKVSSKEGKGTTVTMERKITSRGEAQWLAFLSGTGRKSLNRTWAWSTPVPTGSKAGASSTTTCSRRDASAW